MQNRFFAWFVVVLCFLNTAAAFAQNVSTLAGNGTDGYMNGQGASATFKNHQGALTVDGQGNVYVADAGNFCVRKITPAGVVTTFSGPLSPNTPGNQNGASTLARYQILAGIAADVQGNLYTTEPQNPVIRKINPSGDVLNFSGAPRAEFYTCRYTNGPASVAEFYFPNPICVSKNGNVYIGETYRIRKIDPAGNVTILAGDGSCAEPSNESQGRGDIDGQGTSARFWGINGITTTVDQNGNDIVYVTSRHCVRKVSHSGLVQTIAGSSSIYAKLDATGTDARFFAPWGIVADRAGDLYVSDAGNRQIRKISFKNGQAVVTTVAGSGAPGANDGLASNATFTAPYGLGYWYDAATETNVIYIMDNNRVRALRIIDPVIEGFRPSSARQGESVVIWGRNLNSATKISFGGVPADFFYPAGNGQDAIIAVVGGGASGPIYLETPSGYVYSNKSEVVVTPRQPDIFTFIDGLPSAVCSGKPDRMVKTILPNGTSALLLAPGGSPQQPNLYFLSGSNIYLYGHPSNGQRVSQTSFRIQLFNSANNQIAPQMLINWLTNPVTSSAKIELPCLAIDGQGYYYGAYFDGDNGKSTIVRFRLDNSGQGQIDRVFPIPNVSGDLSIINNFTVDPSGNMYFCNQYRVKIYKMTPDGNISWIAGGDQGVAPSYKYGFSRTARFSEISCLKVDSRGILYIIDAGQANAIMKMIPFGATSDYIVARLAGSGRNDQATDGIGNDASFYFNVNSQLVLDETESILYVTDTGNHLIRKVTQDGLVCTYAGIPRTAGSMNGALAQATFNQPSTIGYDPRDKGVYICEVGKPTIRKIAPWNNPVITQLSPGVVGAGAQVEIIGREFTTASAIRFIPVSGGQAFDIPAQQFTVASDTKIIVTLPPNVQAGNYVAQVTITTNAPSNTLSVVSSAQLTIVDAPTITGFSPASGLRGTRVVINGTNFVSVSDVSFGGEAADSYTVVSPTQIIAFVGIGATGSIHVTTPGGRVASSAPFSYSCSICPPVVAAAARVSSLSGSSIAGFTDGAGASAQFNAPYGTAADAQGNVYVADYNNHAIRKVSAGGVVSTLAGTGTAGYADGAGTSAQFANPAGVALQRNGTIVIADVTNNRIRQVTPAGDVSSIGGNGTAGYADGWQGDAQFSAPSAVAVDAAGTIYVADAGNHRIRKISPFGIVTTIAGSGVAGYADGVGTAAQFNAPAGVAVDGYGNVFVSDQMNHRIRKIAPNGTVTTVAGNGAAGFADGVGTGAQFSRPTLIAVGVNGVLYVADQDNNRVRSVQENGTVSTVAGGGAAAATTMKTIDLGGNQAGVKKQSSELAASAQPKGTIKQAKKGNGSSEAIGKPNDTPTTQSGGYADGNGDQAEFNGPTGVAVDVNGNIYVADFGNNRIRKISPIVDIAPTSFSAQTPATSGLVGTAYTSYTFVADGNPAPTYSVASGTLPTGLTLSSAGVLSGTPTAAGSYTFTVQASNSTGSVSSVSITIAIIQPITTISSFTPASGTIGSGVTIRGTGFTGATTVSFGGTPVVNFTVVSDSIITATLGNGASGSASVTTPNGTGTLAGFTYTPLTSPVISSFNPTSARPGDTVVIRGVRFFTASTVSFGGVAVRYTVVSDSVIHAYISTSVVSGAVNVVNAAGNSTLNGFTFIPLPSAPRITSFTPNRAAEGASVVITGTNLTGATRVKFGAFDAASYVVNSATQITAVVGTGSSGAVSVQTAGGTFSLNGFTFVPPSATLSGFMPTSAAIGTTVIITGTNLSSTLSVEFGGRSAVFTINSDSQITATVPSGAASGNISVTTLAGAASIAGFTFLAPPVVTGFSPTSAGIGASVVIAGTNFSSADTVRIGGVSASFVVNSASQITATVPASAASGSVSVRTPYGTSSLAGFVFIPSPVITSFSPAVAGAGDVVTVNGTNFTGATSVSFGGVPAASFTVVSATRITAIPSASGASGDISVTTPNGIGARSGFSFAGVPVITAFSPTGATGGDTVTITGTGFVGVSTLTFGNTAATSFTIVSPTEIKAVVSPRGSTGAVRLVTPGGTATLNGFVFTAPAPVITGFSPASATVEQTVTITGRNFAGDLFTTLSVSFGGRAAGRFTVVNDSTITAAVGGGATGSVSVRTPGGTANRAGFTFIPAAPVITGFTPASAPAGATITISGNNFFAASAVRFGGVAGTSLVVVNDSTVTVRVAASGASGVVTLTTPSGTGTSASAFTFIPAPVISAFAPASASVGDTVSITGTGFTGVTAVRFGGTAALRFTVVSDTEIQAVVNGGATGVITVVSPNGTGTLAGFTYLPPAPRITSFTPATAAAGTSVVINGSYFTGTTVVNFGGVAAQSFIINSATRITAVVAAGSASGDITVTSPNGTGTRSGFTFLAAPPAITSFSPASAPAGGTVLIRGTGFTSATAVRFGGVAAASFTRTGDTLISARVATSGASGDVSVVSVAGTGTLSGFVFIPAPVISSFTPTSAAQGDVVTIAGANFLGTSTVRFGSAVANIVSVNATQIVVLVGAGATGSLSLTTPGGSASKTGFTYLPPGPRITGFTPATATPGTSVVISGSSFTGATAVSFGGIAAQSFVVNSATRITAVVPVAAQSGDVSVTTPLGTASMAGFTFTPVPSPVITSFTPTTMPSGSTTTTMTINGRNFTGATAVSVGGVAVPFTIVSATRITARLTGAFAGAVSVTTPGGTATMAGFVLTSLFDMKSGELSSSGGSGSSANNAEEVNERLNVVAGVSDLDAPPLAAFPNPASESVTLTGSGFAEGRLVSLTLVNALGQAVMTLTQQPIGGFLRANVDVRDVPSGAYTALLSDGVLRRVVRFVKR